MTLQTLQHTTASRAAQSHVTQPTPEHRHDWRTESSHNTADGVVRYARCHGCAARRIELQPISAAAAPISREFGPESTQPASNGARWA